MPKSVPSRDLCLSYFTTQYLKGVFHNHCLHFLSPLSPPHPTTPVNLFTQRLAMVSAAKSSGHFYSVDIIQLLCSTGHPTPSLKCSYSLSRAPQKPQPFGLPSSSLAISSGAYLLLPYLKHLGSIFISLLVFLCLPG